MRLGYLSPKTIFGEDMDKKLFKGLLFWSTLYKEVSYL